jgi:hypothetical protein
MALGLKIAVWLGITTGTVLAVAETLINWGNWQWWPLWLIDYVAATGMIAGGLMARRGRAQGQMVLASGFAFTFAMSWMVIAWIHENGFEPASERGLFLGLVGALLASSVLGLFLTLLSVFGRKVA